MASKRERERVRAGEEDGSRLSFPLARCSTVPYRPASRRVDAGKSEMYRGIKGGGRIRYLNAGGGGQKATPLKQQTMRATRPPAHSKAGVIQTSLAPSALDSPQKVASSLSLIHI